MVRKNTEKLKLGDQRTVIQEKGYLPQNLYHITKEFQIKICLKRNKTKGK